MRTLAEFLHGCLWLLWMVFFRPNSFRREVEQLDRRQRWRLVMQAVVSTAITPIVLTLLVGLLLGVREGAFDFPVDLVGVAGGVALGVAIGVAIGVAGGVTGGVTLGVVEGVTLGVTLGVVIGVAGGVAMGVVGGVAMGVAWGVGYFRLFLIPVEVATTLWAVIRARQRPHQAPLFLWRSLAYWDEVMLLPQPFLTSLLVIVGQQDREALLGAAAHLTTNTFQRRVAVNALLELTRQDLLRCHTLSEIAQVQQNLGWLTPHLGVQIDVRVGLRVSAQYNVSAATDERKTTERSGRERIPRPQTTKIPSERRPSGLLPLETIDALRRCQQISAEVAAALSATSNYQKLTALNRARRQLDDLQQFAVLSLRRRESQVFAQVAQQWLAAVNAEIDRLTEETRVAQSIPNPYIAPRPLSPGSDVFVGRRDVFRFVEEHFLRTGRNVPVVLHGQPRIGKSSVLRHFSTRLPTNLIPVYIDMQRAAQVESTAGLLFNVADTIVQEMARRRVSLPTPFLDDYATEPFIIFGKFLDAVEQRLQAPDNQLILILDEFEEIERKLTEGKISQDLLPFLRNMMQHRQGIALLFAGTHTLDEMIQNSWVPYFRSAVPYQISYLNEADTRQLITNPIEDFPLNYTPKAIQHLIVLTHCHPCLIQLACSALVDLKNEQRSLHVCTEDIEQIVAKVLETGDYVFQGIWDWIPSQERAVLSLVAPTKGMSLGQLTHELHMPTDEAQRIVERLCGTEVLEITDDNNEQLTYRFQVELLRQWVTRHGARAGTEAESFGTVRGAASDG